MTFNIPSIKRHFHLVMAHKEEASSPTTGTHLSFHYGRERGILLEHVDDTQLLLVSLLDGHHAFADIVARLQAHASDITAEDVAEALDELSHVGLIEDAQISPPQDLTTADLIRYDSQMRFFSIFDSTEVRKYEMQARLKRARVAVLGLGGMGSNVVIGLAAAGVGFIRGVDFDVVELGNLNRQVLYDVADVGQLKVLAAAEHVRRFNPEIIFEPVPCHIDGVESIVAVIKDCDVVVMCADYPPVIYAWMNAASLDTGIPFIMSGYRGGVAEIGPFVVPFQTSCIVCKKLDLREDVPDILAWVNDTNRLGHPTSHFVTALAANLTCSEIFKHITGIAEPATYNKLYSLDIEHFTLTPLEWPRSEQCDMCSSTITQAQRHLLLQHVSDRQQYKREARHGYETTNRE